MASGRRLGAPDAKNRAVLLEAAERLMLEDGYAAVSSRRVADRAGLKPQLVHYYFRTMDDLFLEVFRRRAEEGLERQAQALASPQPLRALWEFSTDARGTALSMEFAALANHRKALKAEIARYSELFRVRQVEALTGVMASYGIDPEVFPPLVMMVLLTAVSRVLSMEESLDFRVGHAETVAIVEQYIRDLEGEPVSAERAAGPAR